MMRLLRKRLRTGLSLLLMTAAVLVSFGGRPAMASSTTVTFPDFSDISSLELSGTTAMLGNPVTDAGGHKVLRLTNNLSQAGGAFLRNPIALEDASGFKASFSTAFQFRITDPVGCVDIDGVQGADGLVFVVQTNSNQYGGAGGNIGYGGIPKSVGIEFDTWYNGGVDSDGNHVGVDTNGSLNSVARQHVSEGPMNNGNVWNAWVDYNGDTQVLEVRLSQNPTRPASALLTHTIDLPAILQQSQAYVGFVSGTGCAGGDHDVIAWQFTNTFAPLPGVCDPADGLEWQTPLSSSAAANILAGDALAIGFKWTSCTADGSVTLRIRNAATNQLITGYTLGAGITFNPGTGIYEQLFTPAYYGVAPGTQLKAMVYFGGRLRGTALFNVQ